MKELSLSTIIAVKEGDKILSNEKRVFTNAVKANCARGLPAPDGGAEQGAIAIVYM